MKLLTISAAVMLLIVATIAFFSNQIIMGILSLAPHRGQISRRGLSIRSKQSRSVVLSPTDPVNPVVSDSWATPVFGVVYFVLVVVALASLMASKWIPAPVKVAIAVAILVLPFVGSIAWIIYSQVRQRGLRKAVQKIVERPVEVRRGIGGRHGDIRGPAGRSFQRLDLGNCRRVSHCLGRVCSGLGHPIARAPHGRRHRRPDLDDCSDDRLHRHS